MVSANGIDRPRRRIALVHDFLLGLRGAERVFLEMCEIWLEADIFTPVYDEQGTEGRFSHRNVQTSFLQRTHPSRRTFRALLPLYPAAIEGFDLSGYDLVVSSSSAWAHAVVCDPGAVHVSYCYNPFRYAWNERHSTLADRGNFATRAVARGLFRRWREWDWIAAQRVDRYVAISRITQARIETYFGRESHVVYPPVEVGRFAPHAPQDHYLMLSEVVAHKQIDVAVAAFARLGLPLVVAGDGPALRDLRRWAPANVTFAGRVTDAEAARLMATCRAFVVTATEEFGIAAVEAQAAGRPVIARKEGGVLETVLDGQTGCFWEGGPDELAAAVRSFDDASVDSQACVRNASRFSNDVFRRELPREVERAVQESTRQDTDSQERRVARRRAAVGRRGFTPRAR
jgi:glycosyltransferase involved in cell wall biosynthesis